MVFAFKRVGLLGCEPATISILRMESERLPWVIYRRDPTILL